MVILRAEIIRFSALWRVTGAHLQPSLSTAGKQPARSKIVKANLWFLFCGVTLLIAGAMGCADDGSVSTNPWLGNEAPPPIKVLVTSPNVAPETVTFQPMDEPEEDEGDFDPLVGRSCGACKQGVWAQRRPGSELWCEGPNGGSIPPELDHRNGTECGPCGRTLWQCGADGVLTCRPEQAMPPGWSCVRGYSPREDIFVQVSEVSRGLALEFLGYLPPSGNNTVVDPLESSAEFLTMAELARIANELSVEQGLETCYDLEDCYLEGSGGSFLCESIGWEDLRNCNGVRLPTEEEWRRSALAGSADLMSAHPTAIRAVDFAWLRENSGERVQESCLLAPNISGICDMLGNVEERVHEHFSSTEFSVLGCSAGSDPASLEMCLEPRRLGNSQDAPEWNVRAWKRGGRLVRHSRHE